MYGMECGHRFCKRCWSEYLTTKIMEEGMGQTIACAAHNCPILVDDKTVTELVTDPKVKLKYQHLITNSFVQVYCMHHIITFLIRVYYNNLP
jgi:ariadne-1